MENGSVWLFISGVRLPFCDVIFRTVSCTTVSLKGCAVCCAVCRVPCACATNHGQRFLAPLLLQVCSKRVLQYGGYLDANNGQRLRVRATPGTRLSHAGCRRSC